MHSAPRRRRGTAATRAWAGEHLGEPLTLAELAAHARMSVRTFTRRFREETGVSPLRWLAAQRLALARQLLESTDASVDRVAADEVAAFEGLVGCHGGLGGWQDRACAVVPVDVPFPAERVVGADAMHVALRDILRHLGHRQDITEPGEEPPVIQGRE